MSAQAADVNWIGTSGDWEDVSHWDTGALPGSGDVVWLNNSDSSTYKEVTFNTTDHTIGGMDISAEGDLSNGGDTVMSLNHSAGKLTLESGGSLIVNGNKTDEYGYGGYAEYNLSGLGYLVKTDYEVKIGTTGLGYFNQSGDSTFDFSGALYLGEQASGYGIYNLSGGSIVAGPNGLGSIVLGEWGGTGEFNQSGGSVSINDLTLARQDNATGFYTMSQDDGVSFLSVLGELILGNLASGYGEFNLYDGTLSASNEYIGGSGTGLFNQYGGTNFIGVNFDHSVQNGQHELIVARFAGSTGTYNLGGGELYAAREIVGDAGGYGEFHQFGSSIHEVFNDLIIGQDFRDGLYGGLFTLSDSASLAVDGDMYIGDEGGTGTFEQSGTSTVNIANALVIGTRSETGESGYLVSNGTYNFYGDYNSDSGQYDGQLGTGILIVGDTGQGSFNMTGGTLNINNNDIDTAAFVVGNHADSVGTFTQSGGDVFGGRALSIGLDGGNGTYNLNADLVNGTTPTLNTGFITLGYSGTGIFNQQAGTTNNTGSLFIGASYGNYNQFGGDLFVGGQGTIVGTFGYGEFDQSGGTHTTAALILGSSEGSMGTYNMTGGELVAGNTTVGDAGFGTFNVSDTDAPSTHTINGNLILGNQETGNGSYAITGDTSQLIINFVPGGNSGDETGFPNGYPNGALIVGNYGTGSFTQGDGFDSPTVTVAGDLILGHQGQGWGYGWVDSIGTYTLNSGTLTVDGNIGVGGASTAVDLDGNPLNVFTQNGGMVNITGSAYGNPDYVGVGTSDHTGGLFIGGAAGENNDGGTGAYIMNGGELNAGYIEVGHSGVGIMTQSGDSTVNTWSIWLGNAGGSNGTYNLINGRIDAVNEVIALGGTGTFTQNGGVNAISNLLDIGFQSTQGTYNLIDGSLSAGRIIVGDGTADNGGYGLFFGDGGILNISGSASLTTGELRVGVLNEGIVNQSGGTVSAGSLTLGEIGSTPNGRGYYNLTGNGQLSTSSETIGVGGYGKFTQGEISDSGLTENNTNILILGAFDNIHPNEGPQPRAGEYILNTGTLWATNEIVGSLGVGIFTQNGGTHAVAEDLVLGDQTIALDPHDGTYTSGGPSEGTYNLNGGYLQSWDTIVGNNGIGVFNHSGGTNFLYGGLVLGNASTGNGTYNLSGTGVLEVQTGAIIVGADGAGLFTQSGGSFDAAWMDVGMVGSGAVIQSGGSATVYNNLGLGRFDGSNGSYTMNGSNASLSAVEIEVGIHGEGTFTQSAGTVTAKSLVLGYNRSGDPAGTGNGTYTLSGAGQLTINGTQRIGLEGTGTFIQTGGTNTVGALILGQEVGSNGSYKLEQGDLLANFIQVGGAGIGEFTQTGGTLTATNIIDNDTFTYSGGSLNFTRFSGTGKFIGNMANTTTVAPGTSPGTLTIQGNYSQDTAGILEIELASLISFDILDVNGTADLAGTLRVLLYDGYTPADGSWFDILTADAINGTFGTLSAPSGWSWNVAYLDLDHNLVNDTVRLTANAVPIPPTVWIFGSALLGLVGFRRRIKV